MKRALFRAKLHRAGMQEFIDTVGSKQETLQTFACLTFSATLVNMKRFVRTAWRKTQTFSFCRGERFYPEMDVHCSWINVSSSGFCRNFQLKVFVTSWDTGRKQELLLHYYYFQFSINGRIPLNNPDRFLGLTGCFELIPA